MYAYGVTDTDGEGDPAEARIAANIARLRKEHSWSQGDLARAMQDRGFSWYPTTVSRIEKGERPLRLVEGVALADVFIVPVDRLAGDAAAQELLGQLNAQYGEMRRQEAQVRAGLRALGRFRSRLQLIVTELRALGVVSTRVDAAEQALDEWSPKATWERYKREAEQSAEHQEEA